MIPHRLIGAQRTLSVCSRGESLPFGNWGRPSIKYFPYGVGGWGAQPHSMAFGGGTFFGRPPNQQFQLSGSGPNFSTRSLPVSHGVSSLFHSILGRFSSYSTWLASSKFFLAILFVFLYLYFYRTHVYLGSDLWVRVSVTEGRCWNYTSYRLYTSYTSYTSYRLFLVAPSGGQIWN